MSKKKVIALHITAILLTLGLIAFCLFECRLSFVRLFESGIDLWNSIKYVFYKLFLDSAPDVTVTAPSSSVSLSVLIPESFAELKLKLSTYGNLLFSSKGLIMYLKVLLNVLKYLPVVIMALLPLLILFFIFKSFSDKNTNNKYGKESKPLVLYKKLTKHFKPFRNWCKDLISFLKEEKTYLGLWGIILLLSFNIVTIVLEAVAYYLYLTMSFDFGNLYIQFYKLVVDLGLALSYLPWPMWAVGAFVLFDKFRKGIALQNLMNMEKSNRGYVNSLPISNMIIGPVGSGKTTVSVDMSLTQEILFREKQHEKLLDNDFLFPNFPWSLLELCLKEAMECHEVYNLATCKAFIDKIETAFTKEPSRIILFDYDYERYGLYYDNKLEQKYLFDVIRNYAQLYFMYTISSPFLVSNLSIRDDNVLCSEGNFPKWNSDFFSRDTEFAKNFSRYSHILDFDMVRLGKTVLEYNRNKDAFEFGVVCITEIGKERGNQVENSGKKKGDESTNQLNDLFNTYLKMCRHSATVDNFPFIKFFFDEQRASSLGADAKELCNIIKIAKKSELKLAMPFFDLFEIFHSFIKTRFENFYNDYRYRRADTTLFAYLYKSIFTKVDKYYKSIYNRFSYRNLELASEAGTMDEKVDINDYYLITKKIYSRRFATNCFSDFFANKALRSSVGLNDLDCYQDVMPTFDELDYQNSYFVNDINKIKEKENDGK